MNIEELRQTLATYDQAHLLTFWDELDSAEREALVGDIRRVDFEQVCRLIPTHVTAAPQFKISGKIAAAPSLTARPGSALYAKGRKRGAALVAVGKVAAMVVAGGQGTRLGFDGPKGMYSISPAAGKSLFQLFAESILATQRRYGGVIPWYIMTSAANDAATRDYFETHRYFGLGSEHVVFFQQGAMPAIGLDGKILLANRHRIAMSPDGHGGSVRALAASGALADMARRGVEAVSYFQVDNPLVTPVDPLFIGLHDVMGSEASSLAVPKVDDLEKAGNFVAVDGTTCVIEYSDLPEELAHARNADGSRLLDAVNPAVHVFARSFLERLTADIHAVKLPWHRAIKKVPCMNVTTGERIEPEEPNAVKLEMLVFDALPLATKTLILNAERGEVFSPVKNATGVDSAVTARRDMIRRAAKWLTSCGVEVPTDANGEPDAILEISPLYALDAEQLREVMTDKPVVPRGDTLYLGNRELRTENREPRTEN